MVASAIVSALMVISVLVLMAAMTTHVADRRGRLAYDIRLLLHADNNDLTSAMDDSHDMIANDDFNDTSSMHERICDLRAGYLQFGRLVETTSLARYLVPTTANTNSIQYGRHACLSTLYLDI